MPNHPTNWPSQRHHLTQALKHLAKFTDNLQTFLELSDEAEAQVLTLDFGTSSVIAVMDELRAEAEAETNMAKRNMPSREEVPNIRRPWTFDEIELVVAGRKLGLNNDQIGNKLGRTGRAVEAVVTQLRREDRL